MHTYQRPTDDTPATLRTDTDPPSLRSIDDLIGWASSEPAFGGREDLTVWHLDDSGEVTCWQETCSKVTLAGWSRDPSALVLARLSGLDRGGCGADWLVTDSRTRYSLAPVPPDNDDVESFLVLRAELADIGVRLLDVVVFDHDGHWWSLRELAVGSTDWSPGRPGGVR